MKKQKQNKTTNQNKTLNILCFAKPRDDDDDRKRKKEARNTTTTFSFICDLTYFFQYVSYVMIICKMSNLLKFLKMI